MITDIPLDSDTRRRLGLLFVATALMLASVLSGWLRPEQELVRQSFALVAALIVAIPIVSGLINAIRSTGFAATQFYMDQYVVLALAACLATEKYLTGAIVAIVLLFGQMLEERTTVGVEMALAKLRQLSRVRARRLITNIAEGCVKCRRIIGLRSHGQFGHSTEEVEAVNLNEHDEILILPGEAIPADAIVLTGAALIDQSSITGESVPVEVGPGSEIFAGTNNLNGAIEARVTGTGTDTVMGRVQSIIEEAKESEAPIISLAEDYARYYTPLILLIAVDGSHVGTFLLADRIRPEAKETLDRLRSLGITDFVMLTGDRTEVAETIAARVGITDFKANCLPQDKVDHIRALKAAGKKVMVVGDGLNDAPALAEGDLGVAMGALGNDVTVHTSDVALMSGDLRRLADLLLLSSKTVNIINQNLLCGFAFIIIAIALSSLGFVNPIAAAFFHEFSAFFVIFNSARLLRFDGMETGNAEFIPQQTTEQPIPA